MVTGLSKLHSFFPIGSSILLSFFFFLLIFSSEHSQYYGTFLSSLVTVEINDKCFINLLSEQIKSCIPNETSN